jgi:predicted protein tyrosine phosphatase
MMNSNRDEVFNLPLLFPFCYNDSKGNSMFEIKVSSYDGSKLLIEEGWPTKIISLLGHEIPSQGPHHLILVFDDVAGVSSVYIHPTEEHLDQVLEFSKDFTDDDRVLVHCLAGISRSTAIAIAIVMQHGMDYYDAYNHVEMIRPILEPNKLIIRYVDAHFGLDGKLIEMVTNKKKFPHLFYKVTSDK